MLCCGCIGLRQLCKEHIGDKDKLWDDASESVRERIKLDRGVLDPLCNKQWPAPDRVFPDGEVATVKNLGFLPCGCEYLMKQCSGAKCHST